MKINTKAIWFNIFLIFSVFPSAGGNKVFEQQVGSVPPSKPSAPEEPRPLIYGHGPGTCPTGVQAVPGEKPGQIVLCNGMRPNCPPRLIFFISLLLLALQLFSHVKYKILLKLTVNWQIKMAKMANKCPGKNGNLPVLKFFILFENIFFSLKILIFSNSFLFCKNNVIFMISLIISICKKK